MPQLRDGLPENLIVSKNSKEETQEQLKLCFNGINESDDEEETVFSCNDLITSLDMINETLTTVNESQHEATPGKSAISSLSIAVAPEPFKQ